MTAQLASDHRNSEGGFGAKRRQVLKAVRQ
jgi:hypothetical protein